jgi:glycosyltransferase involved in cell wall biosynthesis
MMPRRVLIDGYFLGKPYGFGRFIFELCRALGSTSSDVEIVVAVPVRPELDLLPTYRCLTWHMVPDANFVIWEQVIIPRLARKLDCRLIHFPYNTRALWTGGIRTVTTVHDVIFLTDTVPLRRFKPWLIAQYAKQVFRMATGRSDVVISVSDTTRAALAGLGLQATTIYNTIDGFRSELKSPPLVAPQPYFLHRGGYLPHRNTERVIQAFRRVRKRLPNFELRIVGAPDGAVQWGTSDDSSIHYLPRLSDAELAACYAGSACVVAASLQEGFGLPVIEGFGFDTPVITSDLEPMREIAGNAALLVDPYDVAALEEAMVSVVTNHSLAMCLREKGRIRLVDFSSTRVADQMIDVYTSCF